MLLDHVILLLNIHENWMKHTLGYWENDKIWLDYKPVHMNTLNRYIGSDTHWACDFKRRYSISAQEGAWKHVNQALVLITLGGNDFVNNYYLQQDLASFLFQYVNYIISEYRLVWKFEGNEDYEE
ncbi:uncharacterized protein [Phaseolus vulgaris]|uniref:uncharacterized protein isoform X2 n=1 Tax=Phaseolus vulgaris TaxID=3885 RepID=UPI0035C9E4DD